MLVFPAFLILLLATAIKSPYLSIFKSKKWDEWILDYIGLCFQGIIIPVLQITIFVQIYKYLLLDYQGAIALHPLFAFLLSFVFVDYLYYWNHRLFHSPKLWNIHRVHHTVTSMDVLGTSRNTLWASFFIVYLWVHSLFIYLLQDPTWYIFGVSLTSALDLWRHSEFSPLRTSFLYHFLSSWLTLPQDHAYHHGTNNINSNYGANFKLWDKIHGTYYQSDKKPESLGVKLNLTLMQKLFLPFD
jgi:sterol desaturase/sphingolipid hydroxylase (fatty acid hydroxylase superfamily)